MICRSHNKIKQIFRKLCAHGRNPENNRGKRGALCPVGLKREKVGIKKLLAKSDLNIDILILKTLTKLMLNYIDADHSLKKS